MENKNGRNLFWHKTSVSVDDRRELCGYRSCVIWFTGLPASGKSTLANALCLRLHSMRIMSYVLDGDNVRHGLNRDLGFSPGDRDENIRRIGEVARLFVDAGLIVMAAFISPKRENRRRVRDLLPDGDFVEVYVKCDTGECEKRDPKGMYKKALAGEIREFTGVSAPYEEPENPSLVLDTRTTSLDDCIQLLIDYLARNGYIKESALERSAG